MILPCNTVTQDDLHLEIGKRVSLSKKGPEKEAREKRIVKRIGGVGGVGWG